MDYDTYIDEAMKTRVYDKKYALLYPLTAMLEELGELARLFAHNMRDDSPIYLKRVLSECGDLVWDWTAFAKDFFDEPMPKAPIAILKLLRLGAAIGKLCEFVADDAAPLRVPPDIAPDHEYGPAVDAIEMAVYTIANHFNFSEEQVRAANIAKVHRRLQNGTVHGEGDDR